MTQDEHGGSAHLNWLALSALQGFTISGHSDIADILCRLLRSPHEIEPETREALAAALDRGINGSRLEALNAEDLPMPRLVVEGLGKYGELWRAVRKRRQWMNAADALEEERQKGRAGDLLVAEVGQRFNLGFEMMKKAIKFRRDFIEEFDNQMSDLRTRMLECMGEFKWMNKQEIRDFGASQFVEMDAEKVVRLQMPD